jgi:hypothetical protein
MAWEPSSFYPTPRGRRNERLRPTLSELLPLADRIRQASSLGVEAWTDLAEHTEAAWVGRALAGEWPTWARHDGGVLELVCRPNLDLHTGVAGWYRERHGNLRTDDPSAVLGRALELGGPRLRRCGSVPTRCRRLPSWPADMATAMGRGSTSARTQPATCGWTGHGKPDASPPRPARRPPPVPAARPAVRPADAAAQRGVHRWLALRGDHHGCRAFDRLRCKTTPAVLPSAVCPAAQDCWAGFGNQRVR